MWWIFIIVCLFLLFLFKALIFMTGWNMILSPLMSWPEINYTTSILVVIFISFLFGNPGKYIGNRDEEQYYKIIAGSLVYYLVVFMLIKVLA